MMFTGGDLQRFLAFEFDEQKTTEHSNPSDADAADGYFNEADLHHHNMLNLKGLFTFFLFSVRTHILNSNGVWYS